MNERLAAALDQARAVLYDPDGYVLAYFGGHGIHVYDLEGTECAYWTVGDPPGDYYTENIGADRAFESMREHVMDWMDAYGDARAES